jgi:hypothetical protein
VILVILTCSLAANDPSASSPKGQGTLVGKVVDERGPVAYATVLAQDAQAGTISLEDGTFRLPHVPAGTRSIQVARLGCEPSNVTVTVKQRSEKRVVLELPCPRSNCLKATPLAQECFYRIDEASAAIGTHCRVHSRETLRADTVAIQYGIASSDPGATPEGRDSYPNARPWYSGGCVVQAAFTEVAYCRECRRAYDAWIVANFHRR